jgi:hypothetical protein
VSELFEAHADPQDIVENAEIVVETASRPPVVITEQQVAFSTAAALRPLPHIEPSRGPIAALRAMFRTSSSDAQTVPRHYPPRRDEFLESAAMKREMFRL